MGRGVGILMKKSGINYDVLSLRPDRNLEETNLKTFSEADFIIECTPENLSNKRKVLEICSSLNDHAIIASSTSSLSISELQSSVIFPERFLGIHFMNPPLLIPIVELVKGSLTSVSSLDSTEQWLKTFDRDVVRCDDSPGFVLNALLFALLNRAAYMAQDSSLPHQDIDEMLVKVCGHKLGPLATLDLIGIDVAVDILDNLHLQKPELNLPTAPILKKLVMDNHLGKKKKIGFFQY